LRMPEEAPQNLTVSRNQALYKSSLLLLLLLNFVRVEVIELGLSFRFFILDKSPVLIENCKSISKTEKRAHERVHSIVNKLTNFFVAFV